MGDRGSPRVRWTRERATSITVNYTLSLVVLTVLLSGLMLASSNYLESQQEQMVKSELEVLGNRLASDLNAADRLASKAAGEPSDDVRIQTWIPAETAGASYHFELSSSPAGDAYLVTIAVRSPEVSVGVEVSLKTRHPIAGGSSEFSGGEYVVELDPAADELEVTDG